MPLYIYQHPQNWKSQPKIGCEIWVLLWMTSLVHLFLGSHHYNNENHSGLTGSVAQACGVEVHDGRGAHAGAKPPHPQSVSAKRKINGRSHQYGFQWHVTDIRKSSYWVPPAEDSVTFQYRCRLKSTPFIQDFRILMQTKEVHSMGQKLPTKMLTVGKLWGRGLQIEKLQCFAQFFYKTN